MRKTEMREEGEEAVVGTEGGRSPSGVPTTAALPPISGGNGDMRRDPEVLEKPERRRFTAEYKSRILAESERCAAPGALGALLRREGLYSSHLATWRRQREEGMGVGLTPKRRGRKSKKDPLAGENARLLRENEWLREKLRKAELIIDVQKKVAALLGTPIEDSPKLQLHESEGAS